MVGLFFYWLGTAASSALESKYPDKYHNFINSDRWDSKGNIKQGFADLSKHPHAMELGNDVNFIISAFSAGVGPVLEGPSDFEGKTVADLIPYYYSELQEKCARGDTVAFLTDTFRADPINNQTLAKEIIKKYGSCYYDYYAKGSYYGGIQNKFFYYCPVGGKSLGE